MPRDGLCLPIGCASASVCVDISRQVPKGALLWEINGVVKRREDTSMKVQGCVMANQSSSSQPRVRVCLDSGTYVGIQGLPGLLQLGSNVLVYISLSSKMIYTAGHYGSVPHDHSWENAPSLHAAHP